MADVKCNIMIIGTLASGSSALKDMLREYNCISCVEGEFNDYRAPGLIEDIISGQEDNYYDSINELLESTSLKNRILFKSRIWKLFSGLLSAPFWENEFSDRLKYLRTYLYRLNQIDLLVKLHSELGLEKSLEKRIDLANSWIRDIGKLHSGKKEFVAFDQPILPWSDINLWMSVFNPFKVLCVIREPGDQIAEFVKRGILYNPFRSPFLNYAQVNVLSIYGNSHKSMLKFHIDALQGRLARIDEMIDTIPQERLLVVDFEGLAMKYEYYKSKIENFLGICSDSHQSKKKYYDPVVASENSVDIYKNIPERTRKILEEDDDLKKSIQQLRKWYGNRIKDIRD